MAELNDPNSAPFIKKPHRPWKTALLDQALNNPYTTQATLDTSLPPASYKEKITDGEQLKSILQEKNNQKEQIVQKITDKSNSSLLLGGFFQPNNMQIPNSSQNGQKINRLINDLKSKEHEITSLTANLKIAEATDKAEQAELIRNTEAQARISAELRMKKAIDQVHIAASQLGIAIEKAQLAEQAQKEEEKARRIAEGKINKAVEQTRILEQALQTEIQARKAAEDKAQISLNQTIQTELARQEIEGLKKRIEQDHTELTEKFRKLELVKNSEEIAKYELQQQFNRYQEITEHDKQILEKSLQNFQFEHSNLLSHTDELQNQIAGLEELARQQEQQISMLDAKIISLQNQQTRLQQIIDTEQNLRKLADQKANTALAAAAKSELGRKEEEKQRKLTDERAKRAVAHASKTVMKFLDSPGINHQQEKELDDNYLEEILK